MKNCRKLNSTYNQLWSNETLSQLENWKTTPKNVIKTFFYVSRFKTLVKISHDISLGPPTFGERDDSSFESDIPTLVLMKRLEILSSPSRFVANNDMSSKDRQNCSKDRLNLSKRQNRSPEDEIAVIHDGWVEFFWTFHLFLNRCLFCPHSVPFGQFYPFYIWDSTSRFGVLCPYQIDHMASRHIWFGLFIFFSFGFDFPF